MSRILLVTHEASRSGAPRVAQLAAGCLVEQGHDVRVVSRRPGPLLAEFAQIAPAFVEPLWRVRRRLWDLPGTIGRWIARAADMTGVLATLLWVRPDLVYVNSASAAIYIPPARLLRLPVALHFHESAEVFRVFLESAGLIRIPSDVTLIACSPSVQRELEGLDAGVPVLLPSIPDAAKVAALSSQAADRPYPRDELVVGCCGRVEHRKGADLWVDACRLVRQALPQLPLRFVWVGDGVPPDGAQTVPGLTFIGPTDNPYAHINRFTIATLPSRDDPFPLVVMEAMLLGKPIVAFAVGGVPSQLQDTGILVGPEDVAGFAKALVELLADEGLRVELGERARTRAQKEFSHAAFASGLAAIIAKAMGAAAMAPGSRANVEREARA